MSEADPVEPYILTKEEKEFRYRVWCICMDLEIVVNEHFAMGYSKETLVAAFTRIKSQIPLWDERVQ